MTSIPTTYSYNYNNDTQRFKYLERLDRSPEFHDKSVKVEAHRFILRRNRLSRAETRNDKIQALSGALIGTALK
mgnify:CR=1 FL=1